MIGYDLNKPGQNYRNLFDEIKSISGTWCHALDSTWFVVTGLSAEKIRDRLLPHMDVNDELLVARQSGEAAWCGLPKEASDWLAEQLGKLLAV